jgi:site-specific DNA recombinase
MIAAMAHWERDEIASRVAASVPIRAKMGKPLGGAAPYGYAWVEQKLVIDENEAPIRKEMYELFREHRRKKTVARFLNERGYRTRNGSNFSDTTVDRLLRDSTAKGIRRTNYTVSDDTTKAWKLKPESEWVFHDVDPIVSVELWDEVNAILDGQRVAGKRQTRRVAHLFAGYAFCECGSKMYVPSNSPKYVAKCCRLKIGVKDLEDVFKAELTGFVFSPDELRTHMEQGEAEVSKLTDEVERLEKEQKKIQIEVDSLIDLYRSGMLDKEGFGPRYQKQAVQLKQIEDRLPELLAKRDVLRIALISQEEVLGGSRELVANWDNLDHSAKRSVIETILSRITVFSDDSVEIELLYSPGTPPSSTPPTTLIDGNKATNAQGFMAAISWKRAGKSARRAALDIVICPVSSGSRRASRAALGNSGSSSRNKTPLCASEISPGRGGEPPPTSATALAEWCGLRVGRCAQLSNKKRPAKDAIAALSRASSVFIGGKSPANRCASIDLPEPGGPTNKALCPPAAAISRARFAPAWPLTSRKSKYLDTLASVLMGSDRAWLQPSAGSKAGSRTNCATTSNRCLAR